MDKTKLAIDIFDEFAEGYQTKYMDVSLYHDSFDLFCKSIECENANILELACGPGNITNYLLKQRPDFQILATDLSENMLKLAAANNPTANFKLMDCRRVGDTQQVYDAVMCGFCLPYLSKEEVFKLISDVSETLTERGIFYLSTMEDKYSKSGFKGSDSTDKKLFMYFHEAEYLVEELKKHGFEILDLTRQDYPDPKIDTKDLLILARKS